MTRTLIIPPSGLEKVLRRRPEKSTVEEEPIVEGAIVDPCSDGPGSSDDYQPDQEKQSSNSEDEVMDASDKEAPKLTKTAGRTKKAAKGSASRDTVDAERNVRE
ncbi:hypothetical protein K438DRAFT_1964987 [Mycena galopus ATCC 62051]|nr:hypothetical protein K438DRAFT_1964987 [Mycena galopus ATCC 62051]